MHTLPDLSTSLVAGLLLAANPHLERLGLPHPTGATVLEATGASRTTAYKVRGALVEALPGLLGPPGRPPKPAPAPPDDEARDTLHQQVLTFLFDHPGCVSGTALRRHYGSRYHVFVLDLCAEHREVPLSHLAEATGVPLSTLKDWLSGDRPQVEAPETLAGPRQGPTVPQIETILEAYRTWTGAFDKFCDHVQFDWRVPLGRQHIADLLEAHGVRIPKRRQRRPDLSALRGAFETFFPGAQWVGDGTELVVSIGDTPFTCNLELNVDPASGAFVGASLRPTEDSAAVVEAFHDGVNTTGASPLALLLDNKPSNHTQDVDNVLGNTIRLRARPCTPTDKPHAEGAFGLFKSEAPPMEVTASDLAELAGQIAMLVVTTWFRAANHRPRADREGKSRVDLYRNARPTPEEQAEALKRFQERRAAQEQAAQTAARRSDPLAKAAIEEALVRNDLDDPEDRYRHAIASWPLDAVLAGIAVFDGKRQRGTLPEGVDARYLLGIVVNMATEAESMAMADALLAERLKAKDRALAGLQASWERIHEDHHEAEPAWWIRRLVDLAVKSRRLLDRLYWLRHVADVVLDQPEEDHHTLLRLAARHISGTHNLGLEARRAAIRFLFAKAVPVA